MLNWEELISKSEADGWSRPLHTLARAWQRPRGEDPRQADLVLPLTLSSPAPAQTGCPRPCQLWTVSVLARAQLWNQELQSRAGWRKGSRADQVWGRWGVGRAGFPWGLGPILPSSPLLGAHC